MEQETWEPSSFSDDYEVSNLGRVRQKNSKLVLEDVRIHEFLLDAFIKRPENIEDSSMTKKQLKKATKTKTKKTTKTNKATKTKKAIKTKNRDTPVDVTVRGEDPEKFDSFEEAADHLGIPVAFMHRNKDKGFVNGMSIVSRDSSVASTMGPRPKPKSLKLDVTVRGKAPLRFDSPKEAAAHLGKTVATIYKNIDKGFVDRISVAKAHGSKEIQNEVHKRLNGKKVHVTLLGKEPKVFNSQVEAAAYLGKSTNTIRRNIDKGFVNGVSVATTKEVPTKVKKESVEAEAFVGLFKKRKRFFG